MEIAEKILLVLHFVGIGALFSGFFYQLKQWGEGNYAAAREFNEAERKFVASGKVEAAARAAAPKNEAERLAMLAAEAEGKRRAKG